MFAQAKVFNGDIGSWDTSNVGVFTEMFTDAQAFNQDIGGWNTATAGLMVGMFRNATSFNQDLSLWCVSSVQMYPGFDDGAISWTEPRPVWGTCPRGEDKADDQPDGWDKACEDVCYDNWTEALSHCGDDDSACSQAAWGVYASCIYDCSDGNLTREQAEERAREQVRLKQAAEEEARPCGEDQA